MRAGERRGLTQEAARRNQHQTPPPQAALPDMRTKPAFTWRANRTLRAKGSALSVPRIPLGRSSRFGLSVAVEDAAPSLRLSASSSGWVSSSTSGR